MRHLVALFMLSCFVPTAWAHLPPCTLDRLPQCTLSASANPFDQSRSPRPCECQPSAVPQKACRCKDCPGGDCDCGCEMPRPKAAKVVAPAPRSMKDCPCSRLCTCGCNDGEECQCGRPMQQMYRPAPMQFAPAFQPMPMMGGFGGGGCRGGG